MPRATTSTQAKVTKPKKAVAKKTKDAAVSEKVSSVSTEPKSQSIFSRRITWIALIIGVVLLLLALANKYLVIAWVDGKPVTRLQLVQSLQNRYGKDMTEELIVEKLLLSEASKKNITVSQKDIDAEVKKLETQNGGADKFKEMLTSNGLTRDDLSKLIKIQLIREKMFATDTDVTDAELNKYIEDNKTQLPEITDEVKASLKDQLKQQKMATNFNKWLTDNLKSSRVKRI